MSQAEIINRLRARIGKIEQRELITSYPLGIPPIDVALKYGGITAGCCHEIISFQESAALAFILLLLSSITKKGPVVWCSPRADFYTPGFAQFGINDTNIIFVDEKNPKQLLWATEMGLSCDKIAAVLLHTKSLTWVEARRLKLRAHEHNTTLLLWGTHRISANFAATRWLIGHKPSTGWPSRNGISGVGAPRLSIALLRNLYGVSPLSWTVEFDEQTLRFHTVPSLLPSTQQTPSSPSAVRARERVA